MIAFIITLGEIVVIAFGTLSSSCLVSTSGVVCVVCPFADDKKLKNIHVDLALLV